MGVHPEDYVLCGLRSRCAGSVGWGMLVTVTRLLHRLGLMADAGPGGRSEL
ncbi:hypothetical protein [Streptomyces sp. F001]|uniref:hypothetical protein n=1 Tax=Streptomyces sp. F001 TaxID=1510026 RepID=UPI0013EE776D|nr:hypothetical protein [Streptomyces sp. F001]